MRIKPELGAAASVLLCAVLLGAPLRAAVAQEGPAVTSRLIVQFRTTAMEDPGDRAQARAADTARHADRARRLAEGSGIAVRGSRDIAPRTVSLRLTRPVGGEQLESTLAALRANPQVEYVEVDQRRFARAIPGDPLYASQWYLQGVETSATNFESAWDETTGSPDTVIAIIDTGVRYDHPDLAGRLLPGFDFVSEDSSTSFATANDGDGWDDDASDPGDWLSAADLLSSAFADCPQDFPDASSWHGTRVAAMTHAATNNGEGVAGGTWSGGVLPVRVLGKCGGYDSDIVAGMRWAAGLPVPGVPANPNPAQILNLSLGASGSCRQIYRDVIANLTDAGVLVVASAGNDSGPVEAPGNCAGVLAVAGLRHVGTKVGYSSLGPEVSVSAPAGNCPSTPLLCEFSLVTATNAGQTVPTTSTYTDDSTNNSNIGTSFSAPIVAAIAGLMHAVNDSLAPREYIERIQAAARPFPAPEPGLPTCPRLDGSTAQCNCTTATCGAGIADAPGAVQEALRPVARITGPDGNGAGENVVLDGSGSAAARGRTLANFAWTAVSGDPSFVGNIDGEIVTVAVPESGRVTVRLAVTDDAGRADTEELTLGSQGGGGGAMHPLLFVALALLTGRRRRQVS